MLIVNNYTKVNTNLSYIFHQIRVIYCQNYQIFNKALKMGNLVSQNLKIIPCKKEIELNINNNNNSSNSSNNSRNSNSLNNNTNNNNLNTYKKNNNNNLVLTVLVVLKMLRLYLQ
mmetsp:Transcript_165/g.29  ORF Transcript_165/g.29 Transcript_165/m.29 type:complete len:115 (+) Transcript_165:197-541(+)